MTEPRDIAPAPPTGVADIFSTARTEAVPPSSGLPTAPDAGLGLPVAPPSGLPLAPVAAPVAPAPVAPAAALPTSPLAPVAPPAPAAATLPVEAPAPVEPMGGPAPTLAPVHPLVAVQPVRTSAPSTVPQGAPVLAPGAATPGVQAVEMVEHVVEQIVLDDILVFMVEAGGSDLHLSAGAPPTIRVRGEMQRVPGYEPLTGEQIQSAMFGIMTSKHQKTFEERWELDFAYTVPGKARFRVNVLRQRNTVGAVMRTIPWEIKSLDELHLPGIIGDFAQLERGLVLVTGPTGSGKSTTLAAVIDKANRTRSGHIMTIEDPVEFLHQHQGCIVNQREVGDDTHSFADALKHVLRQDPDIILVGEMRDLETISVALTAAETGHLVFGTLHTQSAAETITRVIDVFPPEQQQQVRTQLAGTLQGVVCQTLCRTADGKGRQAAVEIMMATPAIRAQIREDKLAQIPGTLQAGAKYGMQTLNQDLARLVKAGRISWQTGLDKCADKEDYIGLVGGTAVDVEKHIARQQFTTSGFGDSP